MFMIIAWAVGCRKGVKNNSLFSFPDGFAFGGTSNYSAKGSRGCGVRRTLCFIAGPCLFIGVCWPMLLCSTYKNENYIIDFLGCCSGILFRGLHPASEKYRKIITLNNEKKGEKQNKTKQVCALQATQQCTMAEMMSQYKSEKVTVILSSLEMEILHSLATQRKRVQARSGKPRPYQTLSYFNFFLPFNFLSINIVM